MLPLKPVRNVLDTHTAHQSRRNTSTGMTVPAHRDTAPGLEDTPSQLADIS